jgi:hypothetical protein
MLSLAIFLLGMHIFHRIMSLKTKINDFQVIISDLLKARTSSSHA